MLGVSIKVQTGGVGARGHGSEGTFYSELLKTLSVIWRQTRVALGLPTLTHIQYIEHFVTLEETSQ